MKRILLILIAVIALYGCAQTATHDYSNYTMPKDFDTFTFVVNPGNGYAAQMEVINESEPYVSQYELWKAAENISEQQAKYRMTRYLWESDNDETFAQKEEDRIEEYCKEKGFLRCKGIDRTCEEDGCHDVNVTCADDNYDPGLDSYDECRKFDVTVSEGFDDALTADDEQQVIRE